MGPSHGIQTWTLQRLQLPSENIYPLHALQCGYLLQRSLHELQGNLCPALAPEAPPPSASPTWLSVGLFLTLFFHTRSCPTATVQCFALPWVCLAEGLRFALCWIHWSQLEPAVSSTGQALLCSPLMVKAFPPTPSTLGKTCGKVQQKYWCQDASLDYFFDTDIFYVSWVQSTSLLHVEASLWI